MGSKSVDEVLDAAAAGVHYSALRLDGQASATTSGLENGHQEPFVIGVAGGASSGKSTVCKMIIDQLRDQRVVVVTQESFYYGLTDEELVHVHNYNFDHPDAFHTELLLSCMQNLKCGKAVDIPNYNFKTYKSVPNARKHSPIDFSDADVRLTRRIHRDTIDKGRDLKAVLEQFSKFVKPAFEDFILPTKKYADVIIPRGGDNDVAIDLIVQHIRTKLGQHDLRKIHPNLYVIQTTYQIRGMHTIIRDAATATHDFIFYADRLIRLVVEHGLGHLPFQEKQVITPTGSVYTGVEFSKRLCGISVIRSMVVLAIKHAQLTPHALEFNSSVITRTSMYSTNDLLQLVSSGESMENALRACCKGIKIGKILIHREGDNGQQLIYQNLPKDIANRHVLLLDPILGTGNSAVQAISLLLKKGVQEANIIFLNLISAPQGVHVVCKRFPRMKIVTSEIESGLNDDFRVVPGMGEFGDRYFGTDEYQSSTPFFCDDKNRVRWVSIQLFAGALALQGVDGYSTLWLKLRRLL
ncbi:Uridine kinase-like protein 4 [Zea mays]|uniref:Uridine kinase-like protein 4 n=1 Tax=Zea mays TaxID=4577 RepID=A0A3L6F1S5_MAIZE|nr:Uridine kinase-like protein 4 [Zea mays]